MKLTEKERQAVRAAIDAGQESYTAIARRFGIARSYVSHLALRDGKKPVRANRPEAIKNVCTLLTREEYDTLDALVAYESETHGRTTHAALIRKLVKLAAKRMERKKKNG